MPTPTETTKGKETAEAAHVKPARTGQPADPCIMIIFGASGDLTKRKLYPALYNLARERLLSEHFAIIGIARRPMADEDFRDRLTEDMREFATAGVEPELWEWFKERTYYLQGDATEPETYEKLKKKLSELDEKYKARGNYFYYMATSPEFFAPVVQRLGEAGLAHQERGQWRRVIFEKPFGTDLASAKQLNRDVSEVLQENQIYRIDHYLGKETVQNIMVFRFGNGIFEPLWNHRYVDHVQITVSESLGVEGRGGYYDQSGALRDMVPNHIFQLISLTAMEPPVSFDADAVRDEQSKILRAIQPMRPEDVLSQTVRGQYGPGVIDGGKVPGYREEEHVPPASNTETFVAMKLTIDNWRWARTPFYVRTGKRLPNRVTEIAIQYKQAPFVLFRQTGIHHLEPNRLILHLQPNEGISMSFGAKVPGPVLRMGTVDMAFDYKDYFGVKPTTGYERLLYDCMLGDATLFQRGDMTEASWSVVEPILDVWKALPARSFPNYAAGTWGPREADELLARDGRHWRDMA